ncbi:MAG: helix-turn-helix domain-containing protein [Acidaminococcus sp.]|uniref:helix-turn-helix domain-containing protein n=1 Tax=Acidaminococcus sp. TaxID=1872103 RepID=UPI003F13779D
MTMSLKAARINKNLTQREAALLIGVSVDTLANYEKGASFPDVPIIMKIEKVYGLPYSEINFLPQNNA